MSDRVDKIRWWVGISDLEGGFSPSRFFGMLITAALLTMGAPFWFNLLKTMARLRPVLANKIKEEPVA